MKRWLKVLGSALTCVCWAILSVRSWTRESAQGTYLMTSLWGIASLLSFFSLIFWIRQKE
jgi:hypothetical protein